MKKLVARALEGATFCAAVWGFFTLGTFAGIVGFVTFLYVAHELKHVR